MSNPWLKFYPSDWRSDPALRMCSIAARGLWMEMLCVMHENGGDLAINAKGLTPRQLANLAGCGVDEVDTLLSELEDAGVFSRRADGTIYSRRMIRDAEKAETDKANGSKGGNPRLRKGVNPSDNVEDKAQKPEARSQIPESTPPNPQGGGEGNLFDKLVEVMPINPSSKLDRAEKWWLRQSQADQRAIVAAGAAFAAWFWAEQRRKGRSDAEALGFAPSLHSWLSEGGWKSVSEIPSAQPVEPMVKLHRDNDEALWLACEAVMVKKAPTSDSTWSFRKSVVDQARASMAQAGAA